MDNEIILNDRQTPIKDLHLENYPQDLQDDFWEFFHGVPLIQELTKKNRKRACDLPKDAEGKITVDLEHPHILENMDYFRKTAIFYEEHGYYTDLKPNPNPNSEYYKWVKEEIRRCHEGLIRPSDGEWVPGDLYFYWNYTEIQLAEKQGKSRKALRLYKMPKVWDGTYWYFHYLHQAREAGEHGCMLSSRSKGKAHPYSQIVYTPDGPKLWKDIKIGDTLFGDDGKTTTVIDIPFDEKTNIYKVTLSDGRELYCSLGHLFNVRDSRKKNKNQVRTLSLEEIANSDYLHLRKNGKKESYYSIPANKGVEFKSRDVLIDAYTLGLLLGDGCFRTNYKNVVMFTSKDSDVSTYEKNIPYSLKKLSGKYNYRIHIPNVDYYLNYYGLNHLTSSEKFIPKDYIYNSRSIRLEILRGLLDTDGTVNNNGVPMFTTTSKRLCNDIMFICRSLGYNVRMFKKQGKYNNKLCKLTYNVTILTNDSVFKLERKLKLLTNFDSAYSKSRKDWTHIVSIEYSHNENAKCVTVDNESHCYLIGDFVTTHNSFSAAAMLAKRFKLGETPENNKGCTCYITASEKKFLVAGDQTLDKFQHDIDFLSQKTEWPGRELLVNRLNDMMWTAGYKDLVYGNVGTGNSVVGITSKNDVEKLRGTRAVLYVLEEAGTFKGLDSVWQNILPSVEEGKGDERNVFGQIVCFGTSGDEESDFQSLAKMMYHPKGYHIKALANIYDIRGKGGSEFSYFFPAYLNNANCYDKDGNSDITKSLLEILKDRIYTKTHSGNDLNALTKTIAENPIVPQEAILRAKGNFFPTAQINERINELQQNPNLLNEIVTGDLIQQSDGTVKYVMSSKEPIRQYPLPNDFNNLEGAIEFYQMPQKDKDGKVYRNRYIAGYDPIDDDAASSTLSLNSVFILDLWTDEIVCEWTGRFAYADDCYERVRLMALFYNAMILAENNKKGYYSYFAARNCAETLLAEAPDYLKDRNLIQIGLYGNKAKGFNATNALNNLANQLIRTWLTRPKQMVIEKEDGTVEEITVTHLSKLRAMALLRELSLYNIDDNFDRVRALGAVMLYREQFNILYEGDVTKSQLNAYKSKNKLANDKFFTRNYDAKFSKFSKIIENI